MRDFKEIAIGIILTFLLFTVLLKISFSLTQVFNVFSLLVIYFALSKGEVYGAFLGTICGLIYDSFSLGVFGVAGLSKTITGFIAGYVSRKINVTPFLSRFVFIFILITLELILWTFFYSYIFAEKLNTGKGALLFQPLVTAFIGSLVFSVSRRLRRKAFQD